MARAIIGDYEKKIIWERAEAWHEPFFFNQEDISVLLGQPEAEGVTLKTAIINGHRLLVMLAVASRTKEGDHDLFNKSVHMVAFSCLPLRDNAGEKTINLADLALL